ncbi:hypothetical protein GCM10022405_26670 [Gibbsiella dentisursi]|uniref:Uncharacterized protein n=1 Tax=Gibbsiella dentisursi TaxID=796890 RepID=A0ABP7LG61_9GAMM|nr:hypothetical protein BIY27_13125 [Gibbsiella quercinecans]
MYGRQYILLADNIIIGQDEIAITLNGQKSVIQPKLIPYSRQPFNLVPTTGQFLVLLLFTPTSIFIITEKR